jgi:hypothetical protein
VALAHDNFQGKLENWKLLGIEDRGVLSSQQSRGLRLHLPGQAAEFSLAQPLVAGLAAFGFNDPGNSNNLAWLIEAEFGVTPEPRLLRVQIARQRYRATFSGESVGPELKGASGWHRLSIEFAPQSLMVALDDDILFDRRGQSIDALRRVKLVCRAASEGQTSGELSFDDFILAQKLKTQPHPAGDSQQDELWLLSGDQLFGSVLSADSKTIRASFRFGSRSVPWSDVRGVYLRSQDGPARKPTGDSISVWLRSGVRSELDRLEGTVQSLDKQRLILRQQDLGDLVIDRQRLHRLKSAQPGYP